MKEPSGGHVSGGAEHPGRLHFAHGEVTVKMRVTVSWVWDKRGCRGHPANQVNTIGRGGVWGIFWYVFKCPFMSCTFIKLTFMPDFTLGGEKELRHANFVPFTFCYCRSLMLQVQISTLQWGGVALETVSWSQDLHACALLADFSGAHPPFSAPNLKFGGHCGIEEWEPLHTHPHAGTDGLYQTQIPTVCNFLHNSSIYTV